MFSLKYFVFDLHLASSFTDLLFFIWMERLLPEGLYILSLPRNEKAKRMGKKITVPWEEKLGSIVSSVGFCQSYLSSFTRSPGGKALFFPSQLLTHWSLGSSALRSTRILVQDDCPLLFITCLGYLAKANTLLLLAESCEHLLTSLL